MEKKERKRTGKEGRKKRLRWTKRRKEEEEKEEVEEEIGRKVCEQFLASVIRNFQDVASEVRKLDELEEPSAGSSSPDF